MKTSLKNEINTNKDMKNKKHTEVKKSDIMPTYKFNFYIDGKLVYTCYTTRKANAYASELDRRGVDYVIKKIKLF